MKLVRTTYVLTYLNQRETPGNSFLWKRNEIVVYYHVSTRPVRQYILWGHDIEQTNGHVQRAAHNI